MFGTGSAGLPTAAQAAAIQLLVGARHSPEFAEFLTGWQTTAGAIVQGADSVTNIVSGDVRSLVQARDIQGNIGFGG